MTANPIPPTTRALRRTSLDSVAGTAWTLTALDPVPEASAAAGTGPVPATVPGEVHTDLLAAGLREAGFGVYQPHGTYFITTDVRPLGAEDGFDFCRSLPERCGVVAIPNAVFYETPEGGRPYVRFTFCKRAEVLQEAVSRLKRLAS